MSRNPVAADPARRQTTGMSVRVQSLSVDTTDPAKLAGFWSQALGWRHDDEHSDPDEIVLAQPGGSADSGLLPFLLFIRVPEAKQVKNRLHLDLRPDDQAAEVARLEALGARRVSVGQVDVTWVVMADPDGNEFCVLSARSEPVTS
jgi:predicted enzyme related to lactoylglutathione lyase